MGAWGTGNFANDAALDWLAELGEHERPLGLIESTLRRPLEATDIYVGAGSLSAALAAAECVAALSGRPPEYMPESLEAWLDDVEAPEADEMTRLRGLAVDATTHVRDDSELRELWDADPEWLAAVDELLARLSTPDS